MLNLVAMLRRIVSIILTALLSLCFVYFALSILPGDSITYLSGDYVEVQGNEVSLISFIINALTLNLGSSAFLSIPVKELIFQRMVSTLILTILSLIFVFLLFMRKLSLSNTCCRMYEIFSSSSLSLQKMR